MIMKFTVAPRSSWDDVYARANIRAEVKTMPPTKAALRPRIVMQTNSMYTKKSPGCENLGELVSSLLPFVQRKKLSNMIPKPFPVSRNDDTIRHSSGGNFRRNGK